ncbi:MAG: glycosyltransferase family 4 protein, partial [Bdellovibrionota bacterium]
MNKKLIFAIHDLNSRGGQDRSTMEILQKLAAGHKVEAHAFTYEAEDSNPNRIFRAVKPSFRRPALLKMIYFHWITLWRFARIRLKGENTLICATGACSLVSDIVHVQFVHASWNRINAGATLYHRIVAIYNLLTEKIAFSRKKNYIAISHSVKRSLEEEYGAKSVTVVHHGVDVEKFCPTRNLSEKIELRRDFSLGEGEEIILLYVGTYERKGLDACIKSLALLPPALKARVKLLAVGNGDKEKFYSLAKANGVEKQLILWGPRGGIQSVFQAADIFIFPTLYEPFGMVALEAMA